MSATADTLARARRVRLMAFDVDGVLTDGTLYYTDEGVEMKAFSVLDGLGLKQLQHAGITVAIITGRKARCVEWRLRDIGIDLLYQGVSDKLTVLRQLLAEQGVAAADAGFMGDDLIDIKAMDACGFSAAPADGHQRVKPYARLVTGKNGGRGAVREVCEFILAAQDKLDETLAPYLPAAEK
jgi:3-deoxy-D-manno-octulosonate 8-phosphate phosphatase (KDO 8-P phosphatase)